MPVVSVSDLSRPVCEYTQILGLQCGPAPATAWSPPRPQCNLHLNERERHDLSVIGEFDCAIKAGHHFVLALPD